MALNRRLVSRSNWGFVDCWHEMGVGQFDPRLSGSDHAGFKFFHGRRSGLSL